MILMSPWSSAGGLFLFFIYVFIYIYYFKFKVFRLSFYCCIQQSCHRSRADSALQIRFKTTAGIRAVVLHLFSCICGLRAPSWPLHWLATIVLAGSTTWGSFLLTGDFLSCKQLDRFSTCRRGKKICSRTLSIC